MICVHVCLCVCELPWVRLWKLEVGIDIFLGGSLLPLHPGVTDALQYQAFMWVLGIQTQVFLLVKQLC